ncbi:MAG: hypothetical protein KDE31_11950 [Caldilineaceae bacterium]|nr:hypothetical protein [Caldilineaceae bacterium]
MSAQKFTESIVEDAAITWLQEIGYHYVGGPDIAPNQPAAERASYNDVMLTDRLRAALTRLNPRLPKLMSGDIRMPEAAAETVKGIR